MSTSKPAYLYLENEVVHQSDPSHRKVCVNNFENILSNKKNPK
jgi:hypothetical protein